MDHQPIDGQSHEGKTEVEAHHVLGHDQAQIAGHRQQEEDTPASCVALAGRTAGRIQAGGQPQQAAEQQEHAAGRVQTEFGTEQQPGQRDAGVDRQRRGRDQRGQRCDKRNPGAKTPTGKQCQHQRQCPDQ